MAETIITSYWCYQCNRLVGILDIGNLMCPNCHSGFIEAVSDQTSMPPSPPESRRRSPEYQRRSNLSFRRSRRSSSSNNSGDRSPFNPVILLRSPRQSTGDDGADGGGGGSPDQGSSSERLYQLYYDDGAGEGLRPLPQSMSEILLGAGFDRLLDQLSQLEVSRPEKAPASKAAIESMPTVEILPCHVSAGMQCAVCHDNFTIGSEVREMPCKHLYHSECILPWLSIRNSCPVCRHELPSEIRTESDSERSEIIMSNMYSETQNETASEQNELIMSNNNNNNVQHLVHNSRNENEPVGLTIWRLPGGGYAVGRFSGVSRGADRELPVVYTEMDGGLNGNNNNYNNGIPRRVVWSSSRRNRERRHGTIRRLFSNFATLFRRFSSSSSTSTSTSTSLSMSFSGPDTEVPGNSSIPRGRNVFGSSVFSRYMRRNRRGWAVEENAGVVMVRG